MQQCELHWKPMTLLSSLARYESVHVCVCVCADFVAHHILSTMYLPGLLLLSLYLPPRMWHLEVCFAALLACVKSLVRTESSTRHYVSRYHTHTHTQPSPPLSPCTACALTPTNTLRACECTSGNCWLCYWLCSCWWYCHCRDAVCRLHFPCL